MQELWVLCMERRLNVFYKCMKFCWNTFKAIKLYSGANDHSNNSKISKAE